MKVLHVIPSLSKVHGGATHALELMEQALSAQGVDIETATTDDDGPGRRSGKPCGVAVPESFARRWYFPLTTEFYKCSVGFARWLRTHAHDYDLVHVHALFSFTSNAGAWAARRAGVPYVVEPLGTLNRYGIEERRAVLKQLSLRMIEGPLLQDAAAVRFTSDDEAIEARRLGLKVREAVIPLGLAFGEPPPERQARAGLRLLFLSRLDPKKNLESLLDAVELLAKEAPHLHLTIAGDGPPDYVSHLRARALRLGIEHFLEWPGHIEGRAKEMAWRDADVFVLPSFSENFGIAAVEALGAGLPCVLGSGVAVAASVEDAGAGFRVGTRPEEIAEGLRLMIRRKDELGRMSTQAMQLARERYSIDAMGRRLKQLYTQILDR